jgi:hypothetical protein
MAASEHTAGASTETGRSGCPETGKSRKGKSRKGKSRNR